MLRHASSLRLNSRYHYTNVSRKYANVHMYAEDITDSILIWRQGYGIRVGEGCSPLINFALDKPQAKATIRQRQFYAMLSKASHETDHTFATLHPGYANLHVDYAPGVLMYGETTASEYHDLGLGGMTLQKLLKTQFKDFREVKKSK